MSKAIKITLTKAEGEYDLTASKLFGAPVIPESWTNRFSDDVIFFGQIRLSDIAALDTENKLPHTGYLYIFLDTEIYPSSFMTFVDHTDETPTTVIEDFNEIDARFAHLNKAFLMSFEEADEDYDGTRLFGVPSSEPDEDGELLLQFDPLDNETGFLSEIDGYAYFFFGEGKNKLDGARFIIDRS